MSVLKEGAYTSPGRVIGVYKYLLQARNQRENRERLYQILSPDDLLSKKGKNPLDSERLSKEEEDKKKSRDMIKTVVRQCINMGLLIENNEEVELNPKISIKPERQIPSIIVSLFLSLDNPENHDFARVLAWYLAQDFHNAPGNWQAAEPLIIEQIGMNLLDFKFNEPRYGQFDDWSCYLGFSWRSALTKSSATTIPDPTVYLRNNLKNIFGDRVNQQIPFIEFINQLGKYCPVFETGYFREEIEQQIYRKRNHLSTVTSMALRRLEGEREIEMEQLSDTPEPVFILSDGDEEIRISHITYLMKDRGIA